MAGGLAAAVADVEARLGRVRCVAGLVADVLAVFAEEPSPRVLAQLDVSAVVGLLRRVQRADVTAVEVAAARRLLGDVASVGGC